MDDVQYCSAKVDGLSWFIEWGINKKDNCIEFTCELQQFDKKLEELVDKEKKVIPLDKLPAFIKRIERQGFKLNTTPL